MNVSLRRATIMFSIFVIGCVVATFGLLAIFAQLRFSDERYYSAEFTDVSGLKDGDFVRIAGVEVGKIRSIRVDDNAHAVVEFGTDPSVIINEGTKAAVRWANPIGDRYLALLEGAGPTTRLSPGSTIPASRTEPALDLDTLLGGFRPLFKALNPEQVNSLSVQLIRAFQGEGATINSFLSQAALVTNTLADRDELVGEVIGNLDVVLQSFGDESAQFGKAIDSLAHLVDGLAARKTDIANAVAYTNAAAGTIADLMSQARPPLRDVVTQTDRVSATVLADHEYFDRLLEKLPDAYQKLARLGVQGDFITEYLCDLFLKVNGQGGQPVYIKLAGQDTGRCAPK